MNDEKKRLYWLKLKEDFFDEKYIKIMRKLPDGDALVIVYLKIQLCCLKTQGYLYFDHLCKSFEEELAVMLDEDINKVRLALMTLEKFNLVESVDTDTMYLITMSDNIYSENSTAEKVRKWREKKKRLQCNQNVTEVKPKCNQIETKLKSKCNLDIDIYKDKDIDLDIDKEKEIEDKFDRFDRSDKATLSKNVEKADSVFTKELIRKGYIEGTEYEILEFDNFFQNELWHYPISKIFQCISYVLSRVPTNIDNKFMYMKTSLIEYLNQPEDKYKGTWLE